jgi:hypothetical protein
MSSNNLVADAEAATNGEERVGIQTIGGSSGSWGDECLLALTPRQIHDRLHSRWVEQITPATLRAAINLSLAFGSEWTGVNDAMEPRSGWRS